LSGSDPVLNVLLVDPRSENRLLAGGFDGIYLSEDGGRTFSRTLSTLSVVSLDTVDGETVLAGGDAGVFRSTDGGKSWGGASAGLPSTSVLRVQLAPSAPAVAWATTTDGVAKSLDGGKTWADASGDPARGGLPARNLQALAVHPRNPDTVFVATDSFVFSVRVPGKFRRGQYYRQGLYRTDDGGKTWARSDAGLIEDTLEEITAHPSRPFEVWAMSQSSRGAYRSRDAGQTWSLSPGLLSHYPMRFVFFPNSPNKAALTSLHIEEDFGVTENSGVHWQVLSEQTFFSALNTGASLLDRTRMFGGNLHLHGLAIDPANPNVLYAGSVDDPAPFNPKPLKGSHIFKSMDGGKSWSESDQGYDHAAATSIRDIKIDPKNPRELFVATTAQEAAVGNGIWKSADAGLTWARSNGGMPDSASINVILIHPARNILLAGGFAGLWRSTDGGGSWRQVRLGTIWDMEYDPANPDVVYAGGEEGLLRSGDFGLSWGPMPADLPQGGVTALAVNATGRILYVGVRGSGLYVGVDSAVGPIPQDQAIGVEWALPLAPAGFQSALGTGGAVRLSWRDRATNELGFELWRWDYWNGWSYVGLPGPNQASHTDQAVFPGVTYWYYIAAFNEAGYSDWVWTEIFVPQSEGGPP
jgi:photosystem II stability/assembly factor-like uncharacterized protein